MIQDKPWYGTVMTIVSVVGTILSSLFGFSEELFNQIVDAAIALVAGAVALWALIQSFIAGGKKDEKIQELTGQNMALRAQLNK